MANIRWHAPFVLMLVCCGESAAIIDSGSSDETGSGETTIAEPPASTDTDAAAESSTGDAVGESSSGDEPEEPPGEVAPGVYALDGLDADLPYGDLAPIGDRIGDAELVALGEAIHTSGGFLRAKARLTRYLVEQLGFRAVSLETPWADAEAIADYVQTCDGDPAAVAVEGAFYVFADESFAMMLNWLCEWNARHPDDRVVFFGWDTQQPWTDGARLLEYLTEALPDEANGLYAGIDSCNGVGTASFDDYLESPDAAVWSGSAPDEGAHEQCEAGLDVLRSVFETRVDELVAATTQAAYDWAELSLVGIESWEGNAYYYNLDPELSYEARDAANAWVIQRMRDLVAPGARTVILAHNVHVMQRSDAVQWPDLPGPTMTGTVLADALGSDYVSFGIIGYEVGINWGGVSELAPPAESGALEGLLHGLDEPYLYVDLRREDGSPLGEGEEYIVGTETRGPMIPDDQFDGLVYLDRSEPMTPAGS